MDLLTALAGVLVAAVVFRRVSREEIEHESTATPELWQRDLGWWRDHRKDETATRQGVTASGTSRIADSAATIKSNSASQV